MWATRARLVRIEGGRWHVSLCHVEAARNLPIIERLEQSFLVDVAPREFTMYAGSSSPWRRD